MIVLTQNNRRYRIHAGTKDEARDIFKKHKPNLDGVIFTEDEFPAHMSYSEVHRSQMVGFNLNELKEIDSILKDGRIAYDVEVVPTYFFTRGTFGRERSLRFTDNAGDEMEVEVYRGTDGSVSFALTENSKRVAAYLNGDEALEFIEELIALLKEVQEIE